MASSSAAQDEFNTLISSNLARPSAHHPENSTPDASDNESGSATLVASTTDVTNTHPHPHRSIRSGKSKHSLKDRDAEIEDNEDDDDNDDDNDDDARPADRFKSKTSTYYLPRKYQPDANTGPKGVIADAQAFENEKRGSGKHALFGRTKDLKLPTQQRMSPSPVPTKSRDGVDEDEGEEELEDDGEEEDEVVKAWRAKRLGELKDLRGESGAPWRQGGVRRDEYGTLENVEALGYLDAVETARHGTVVVVLIYDEEVLTCQQQLTHIYAAALAALAKKHSATRFLSLHYKDAEMEHAGVPALLAYRDGEKFTDFVPLVNEIPLKDEDEDYGGNVKLLEEFLTRHEVL